MTILAFDLGASSGRAYAGHVDGGLIKAEEIHRFPNQPVQAGKHLYWDILRLYHEIKQGILKAKTAADESAVSESIHGRLMSAFSIVTESCWGTLIITETLTRTE